MTGIVTVGLVLLAPLQPLLLIPAAPFGVAFWRLAQAYEAQRPERRYLRGKKKRT